MLMFFFFSAMHRLKFFVCLVGVCVFFLLSWTMGKLLEILLDLPPSQDATLANELSFFFFLQLPVRPLNM